MDLYQPELDQILPSRPFDAHKGQCGCIAVVAGSLAMLGAAVLTAKAALRSGAGLVVVLTVKEAQPTFNLMYPEFIVEGLESDNGCIAEVALDRALAVLKDYKIDVVALGPGLGQLKTTQSFVAGLLAALPIDLPVVLDADGLNAVSLATFKDVVSPMVLTPHIGEFERLFSKKVPKKIEESRFKLVQERATDLGRTIVLKGPNTVVSNGDHVYVNDTGNPGMATAGVGDVLTGVIAAYMGQGASEFEAAILGVHIHGLAGDMAHDDLGLGLSAGDIVHRLPEAYLFMLDFFSSEGPDDLMGFSDLPSYGLN